MAAWVLVQAWVDMSKALVDMPKAWVDMSKALIVMVQAWVDML
jgi:hypothetical protein